MFNDCRVITLGPKEAGLWGTETPYCPQQAISTGVSEKEVRNADDRVQLGPQHSGLPFPILPSSGWCPVGCQGASEAACQQAHLILVSILLAKFFREVVLFLLLFNRSVVSNSLQPHGLQHARLPITDCPSPTLRVDWPVPDLSFIVFIYY